MIKFYCGSQRPQLQYTLYIDFRKTKVLQRDNKNTLKKYAKDINPLDPIAEKISLPLYSQYISYVMKFAQYGIFVQKQCTFKISHYRLPIPCSRYSSDPSATAYPENGLQCVLTFSYNQNNQVYKKSIHFCSENSFLVLSCFYLSEFQRKQVSLQTSLNSVR